MSARHCVSCGREIEANGLGSWRTLDELGLVQALCPATRGGHVPAPIDEPETLVIGAEARRIDALREELLDAAKRKAAHAVIKARFAQTAEAPDTHAREAERALELVEWLTLGDSIDLTI